MREIPLSGKLGAGLVALVDDEDYERLAAFKWGVMRGSNGTMYARAWNEGQLLLMHRLVLNASPRILVDHRDHDGLDNRRINLRLASRSLNNANRRIDKTTASGYKGVSRIKQCWMAAIGRLSRYLGLYQNPEDAALAYDVEAIFKWGEFACTNILTDLDRPYEPMAVPVRKPSTRIAPFRGVQQNGKRWVAQTGRRGYIGTFDTPEQAARAYNAKAIERYGTKAKLNIVPEPLAA